MPPALASPSSEVYITSNGEYSFFEQEGKKENIKRLNGVAFKVCSALFCTSMKCKKWLLKLPVDIIFRENWINRLKCRKAIMLGKCVSGQGSSDDVSTTYESLAQVRIFQLSNFRSIEYKTAEWFQWSLLAWVCFCIRDEEWGFSAVVARIYWKLDIFGYSNELI